MPADSADVVDGLSRVLSRACRQLAEAGQPQRAGRLAADGWVLLRRSHPVQAQRLDGTMHHAARLEQKLETAARPERKDRPVPATDRVVDVRTEIPRTRHELIFSTFATLPAGTAFVLVNDHDPKPLYYQLAAENPGEFTWEYLDEGPEVWRVRIGRTGPA
ncbi:MAG TPA: DUF2249 domain-containing protein [Cellulomonas sp.]|uniref:DUF2249 domain-containing protein n=1 Tax=Cellulomonas sp. TaxID=40001 RepID=UPI002E2F3F7C|nr:DUF2249 domain-containing protein [Cellulomonas sp.]HEX5333863.1 DUF2249 domain-containing protein [Cellulomonas sp.]